MLVFTIFTILFCLVKRLLNFFDPWTIWQVLRFGEAKLLCSVLKLLVS